MRAERYDGLALEPLPEAAARRLAAPNETAGAAREGLRRLARLAEVMPLHSGMWRDGASFFERFDVAAQLDWLMLNHALSDEAFQVYLALIRETNCGLKEATLTTAQIAVRTAQHRDDVAAGVRQLVELDLLRKRRAYSARHGMIYTLARYEPPYGLDQYLGEVEPEWAAGALLAGLLASRKARESVE